MPVESKRTKLVEVGVEFKVINAPPTSILPSGWTVSAQTVLLNPVPRLLLKVVSSVPSAFSLTKRFLVTPFKLINAPPTSMLPSD